MLSLSALADPTRRRIVELLAVEEYTAGEIVKEFDMSAPAISQHLKLLREAKLIKVRVEGQRRVHSLNPTGFAELDNWLHRIKGLPKQQIETPKVGFKVEAAPEPATQDAPMEIIMMATP